MKNKINIAELLEDCPKGMELYSPIFGEVYLDEIRPHLAIVVTTKAPGDFKEEFLYDGRYDMNGECMIFPSKDQRDWSKFQKPFKDGDVVVSKKGDIHLLRTSNSSYCALRERWEGLPKFDSTKTTDVNVTRFATEEEKEKLFKAIKENGYTWNPETKTLEKLIEPTAYEILSDALSTFGPSHQRVMCIEECAELIDALAKHDRGRVDAKDVITELADASIMVEQMAMLFGKKEFEKEKERKLKRLQKKNR